jgi:hypothetical protein
MSKKQEVKEQEVKAPAQEKQEVQQAEAPVMYLGPNVLSKGLKTYTVYKQEPAELILSLQAEFKTINRLFVPVAAATQAMADIQKKGTPINLAYKEMKQ